MITVCDQETPEEVIADKFFNRDFQVEVSPSFERNGETYRVVLNGLGGFLAAQIADSEPVFVERSISISRDIAGYRDIETGELIH